LILAQDERWRRA